MLRPVSEVFLDKDSTSRFRTGWRELFSQALQLAVIGPFRSDAPFLKQIA